MKSTNDINNILIKVLLTHTFEASSHLPQNSLP